MQRVIKRTFNQSSLVGELMCEWLILPDSANICWFPFQGRDKSTGGGGSFVLGLLNPLCFIKGQFSVREIFAGQSLNN